MLPLRLGTIFRSRDSLRAAICALPRQAVAEFLRWLGDRREWGVKLYLAKLRVDDGGQSAGPPLAALSSAGADGNRLPDAEEGPTRHRGGNCGPPCSRTVQTVEECLTGKAEQYCRIRTLPSDLTGRSEEMVFNAAFLLPRSAQEGWLEAIDRVRQDVQGKGLLLELSGPWPPYHFCPSLEL